MIIQTGTTSLLLITQPDHAALAARIMRAWTSNGLRESARRDDILLAVQEHDNGWAELDASPVVDGSTGRLVDFLDAPAPMKQGVWPRAVERLASRPYAAALVAQHALHVYRRHREDAEWAAFFVVMSELRATHVARSGAALDELLGDYPFLRVGDLTSLTFCNGWTEGQTDAPGYEVTRSGDRIAIAPDPFAGRAIDIGIAARELPARPFASAQDARRAFEQAPVVTLTGVVSGRVERGQQ